MFATKIIGNDAVPQGDETTDGGSILNQVLPSPEEQNSMVEKLAENNQVDKSQAQNLITTSAPLILKQIKNLAGGESVLSFLKIMFRYLVINYRVGRPVCFLQVYWVQLVVWVRSSLVIAPQQPARLLQRLRLQVQPSQAIHLQQVHLQRALQHLALQQQVVATNQVEDLKAC